MKKLAASGFEMKNLSLVGKGYHTDEKVVGFYNMGDRVKFWGSRGAFWGGFWGLFFGALFMTIPLVGHVVVLGYLATAVRRRHRERSHSRRPERARRRALQRRHTEGQRAQVRDGRESRRLSGDGARHGRRKWLAPRRSSVRSTPRELMSMRAQRRRKRRTRL